MGLLARSFKLFRQSADGSSAPERLIDSEHDRVPTSFSPDGSLLSFYEPRPDTLRDIWILDMNEEGNMLGRRCDDSRLIWLLYVFFNVNIFHQ